MYPPLPKSPADLLPLPRCDGPKLKPFDFRGPQKIEFLELIGTGLHSHVAKVRILGQIYALKVFRFGLDWDWMDSEDIEFEDEVAMTAIGQYGEPFYAECRAYGRLQETGYEALSVKCYGYVLLDDDHERQLTKLCSDDTPTHSKFCGTGQDAGGPEMRVHFLTEANRTPPPLRAVVKELGKPSETNFHAKDLRKMLRDIGQLQQLGIIKIDPAPRQIINGKISDFSTSLTTPHCLMTPELNPYQTAEMKPSMERQTFMLSINDYWKYDSEVKEMLEKNKPGVKGNLARVYAFPEGSRRLRNSQRRQKRSTGWVATTFVDPRRYNWKAYSDSQGNNPPRVTAKNRTGKGAKKKPGAGASGGVRRKRPPLSRTPKRWYYSCRNDKEYDIFIKAPRNDWPDIDWHFKDGYLFPLKPTE
ncbi:kinetochore Sim4 complex subunit FTA2-domain-containing protein [Xylariaceae sp. FL0594]|nr:kinetochore Sim4 complex subunit FTA2-domain-containing protein [Xylariaceae sp. FL0594]